MHRSSTRIVVVIATAAMVMALTSCIVAVAGARCRTQDVGNDATHVLVCKNGRWVRFISKSDGLALIARLKAEEAARNTTTTATPATTAPTTTAPTTTAPTTTTAPPPPPSYAISAGYQHTCVVAAGAVKCLGQNTYGQLGNNSTTDSTTLVSTGITDATAVSSGSGMSCALRANGTVWCWGYGGGGMLGDGAGTDSLVPVQVAGVIDATQVSSGSNGSCLRTAAGLARCWGTSTLRGDGATDESHTPTTVSLTGVTKVSTGGTHGCALKSDATVWCWGSNDHGQLGDGSTTSSQSPVQVSGVSGAVDVAAGGFNGASCAVLAGGSVECWGDDSLDQIGDGDGSGADHLTANTVVSISDATAVSMNFYSTCAIRVGGAVKCWGLNGYLGNGNIGGSSTPVDVTGITSATAINGQGTHTCVLTATNTGSCWGSNLFGALGADDTTAHSTPVSMLGLP